MQTIYEQAKSLGLKLGPQILAGEAEALVREYVEDFPAGDEKKLMRLVGKLHALFLATDKKGPQRAIAEAGMMIEMRALLAMVREKKHGNQRA